MLSDPGSRMYPNMSAALKFRPLACPRFTCRPSIHSNGDRLRMSGSGPSTAAVIEQVNARQLVYLPMCTDLL